MPEYIERESLIENLNKFAPEQYNALVNMLIEKQPTADVVEAMHSKWEAGHYEGGIFDGTNFEKCNVCQFERLFDDIRFKTTYNYCPNCGAKMDLKEGAEE